ncbi:F-box only protein 40-like [Epinephelus moara]|uniref:F-box only protein 40-like n=1 Tax=Epinephelus moara TaxID=300413 RepID=UPI00214F3D37|nr:F-box only protein 40-like [Epinephelus moara]
MNLKVLHVNTQWQDTNGVLQHSSQWEQRVQRAQGLKATSAVAPWITKPLIQSPVHMSYRSRASKVQQHVHCDSCYTRRCRTRVEPSVCCTVIPCRLLCGALFHHCKEEDHLLLCPNVRVRCLNAEYGCPFQMPRSSQAAHLQVCPASVVCCSMDWLRWPIDETNPHSAMALQENVLKKNEGQGEPLDLAMALVDQSELYERLKVKPIYPELMEEEEEEEIKEEKKEDTAVGGSDSSVEDNDVNEDNSVCENNAVEETVPSAVHSSGINIEKYNLFEMMFSMERGGCAVAQENLNKPKETPKPTEKVKDKDREKKDDVAVDTSKTGHAPWQEGVLERLGQELTPQEYNMYVVHHGRMLLTFGQIKACTPREDDFVYGSLEPIPVQTLRSFKVPDSYHYSSRRIHQYDSTKPPSEARGVDTSDLEVNEEAWYSDEIEATLLGYAEREVRGHKVSESKAADGMYNDAGTQTYTFRTTPFKAKTTLAELAVDKPLKLRLLLESERVSGRHHRGNSAFTFLCCHSFLRREFATHFRNVHTDIQTSLSGWFEERCPLSYLGCTYSQTRFQPSTHKATVSYNKQLKCFNLRPTLEASLGDTSQSSRRSVGSSTSLRKRGSRARGEEDPLSSLPYNVLCHMASFLDSLSLSQLALVSHLMRQVCSTQLQERGMVTLRWEKKTSSHGRAQWKATPVWEFSHLFSSVDSWHMADVPPISAHLKVCPYYETSLRNERVPLPSMSGKKECSQERMSLVNHFAKKRCQQ